MSQFITTGLLMRFRFALPGFLSITLLLIFTAAAVADKITLKDGTVLEGTAIREPNGYWFKTEDGQHLHIDDSNVAHFERTERSATEGTATSHPHKLSLAATKQRADSADNPIAAVSLWQQFIDSKPSDQDLKQAREEMARWKKLQDEGAQKIKGRWVGGEELKTLLRQVRKLHDEALQLLENNQTLQAIKKLEQAQAIYPNSFPATFELGYVHLLQHDAPKAMMYFDQALRLQPNSPEVLGNVAICQIDKKQFHEAVMTLYRAAQHGDTPEIAQDLVTALYYLSPPQRRSDQIKQVAQAATLLASKYNITGPGKLFLVPLRLKPSEEGSAATAEYYSGSGFLISPDGLILTNRHVVENSKTLLVLLDGKTQKSAEVVKIDDEQDLALIKVKMDKPLPFVRLSPEDSPATGAECTVMGFPMIDRLGETIKVTRGIVSSKAAMDIGADVMIDAKVNPGNSGGPILDHNANVMAIVSMKSLSSASEDSYGLGISAGQIRKFLTKNHIEPPAGSDSPTPMSTEQIVAKISPAVVCIVSTR